ncbi:winged helix-turn-helix transcriptional regulator [Oxyplasma meridianum]|uniref:Winged helix-turn-helix transcriptional regulator n=1 Tax=Oxyplasma meridianum TaxID=3073602 RepID=A0AAX4NHA4_9ARCH
MAETPARDKILQIISQNPGIHFREIQRMSGMAVGQAEYHLYQLEKSDKVIIKEDGNNRRYFLPDQGSLQDRKIIFYLRSSIPSRIIQSIIRSGEIDSSKILRGRKAKLEKIKKAIESMEKDGIISRKVVNGTDHIFLTDRDHVIKVIKRYRKGFIGTLEQNLLSLLDESDS